MSDKKTRWVGYLLLSLTLVSSWSRGQSINSSIVGTVTDPSGAVVPGAVCTLTAVETQAVSKAVTGSDGLYRFANLRQGIYALQVAARGFETFVQSGISLNMNETATVNVNLRVGTASQKVEVTANASPLNFEDAAHTGDITPAVLTALPLAVSGNSRSAASFIVLLPGVNTAAGNNPFESRINGGMKMGDESATDGVSMIEGLMGNIGMVALDNDYPLSPEAVSEVSVVTSNYAPEYGTTTSGVVTANTKSGTDQFHGDLREFLRNTVLNARAWGQPYRPKDIENQFGGSIGGPIKILGLSSGRSRSYFFFNYERWTIRGGTQFPVLSIPSMQERQGDFSDWTDGNGNLIPIYDPATTKANPNYNPNFPTGATNLPFLRQQFMGCDGNQPNVICSTDPRLQGSLAASNWFKYLPTPTFAGPLNNYVSPLPISDISGSGTNHRQSFDVRVDEYWRERDHMAVIVHNHSTVFSNLSNLPAPISYDAYLLPPGEIGPWIVRFNWDHTFSPTLLNNLNYGYNVYRGAEIAVDQSYVDQIPKIPGAAFYKAPPQLNFTDGFVQMGLDDTHYEARPTNIVNDMVTWIRGAHTIKFGGEFRDLTNNLRNNNNQSGTAGFADETTGLPGIVSGNPIASFELGIVDNGNVSNNTVYNISARGKSYALHLGDTWKATRKLSINYGLRWDVNTPASDAFENSSFLDPYATNGGAGGGLGTLAFAGTKWGDASFGRGAPEYTYYHAFSPRLGIAYAPNSKTVIRTGYGVFYSSALYPGWNSGIGQDGFNFTPAFSSSNSGLTPAFLLSQGFPAVSQLPPFISSTFDNGQNGPLYRPFNANREPYAQQWNLTIDRQLPRNFTVSAAYVANRGTRLLSNIDPINTLNPTYLSMGEKLYDTFQPGQAVLDGVPSPYSGWAEQMQACAPTVAQALLPYPQYCGTLPGINEDDGKSFYNSFQLKVEHRMSSGLWILGSYTLSKLLTTADSVQPSSLAGASEGVISPYQGQRNKALSLDDVPQILQLSLSYDLPVGSGKRFLNAGGPADKVLGGWQLVTLFRASSGVPFYFRSSTCNVPAQFGMACIPSITGPKPFLQSPASYDPDNGPLFNVAAFENPNTFNFYAGAGPRVSDLRGPGYTNQDISLIKNTKLTERVALQFRTEAFNVWNWHSLNCETRCFGATGFVTDVASPDFGQWNGNVTTPRTIQFALKLIF
jgi:Carboxypeptidase regulatory-like domain